MVRGWYADGMRIDRDGTRIDRDGTRIDADGTRIPKKDTPTLTFGGPITSRLNLNLCVPSHAHSNDPLIIEVSRNPSRQACN